jgi:hypothetical protein
MDDRYGTCGTCDIGYGYYYGSAIVCSPCSAVLLDGNGYCNSGDGGYADAKTGKFSKQPEGGGAGQELVSVAAGQQQLRPSRTAGRRSMLSTGQAFLTKSLPTATCSTRTTPEPLA